MALSITQQPSSASLSQSPIVFVVSESGQVINSSSFQYLSTLTIWDGTVNDSGSGDTYTLSKYKNAGNVGIFDFSKIINSTLTSSREENDSNSKWYKGDFYVQYSSNGTFVTESNTNSINFIGLDGYGLYGENVTQSIDEKTPHFPLLTSEVNERYYYNTDGGTLGVLTYNTTTTDVTKVVYTSGSAVEEIVVTNYDTPTTSQVITQVPMSPSSPNWPFTASVSEYTIQAYSGVTPLGSEIVFTNKCESKYPNRRIKWKNRFGQFDFFNFDMVSRESMNVESKTYQPQVGTWNQTSFTYDRTENTEQRYSVDAFESITVNTDWVDESYNDYFKQLLVSDEIYLVEGTDITPLTLQTNNLDFKTGVNDKVIQYTFDFKYGKTYKLTI